MRARGKKGEVYFIVFCKNNEVNQEKIDIFFTRIKNIKHKIDKDKSSFVGRYIIYFSLFDVLAKYAFPNEKSPRLRYKKLLNRYSEWEYKKYISITQLKCLVEGPNCKIHEDLKKAIKIKVNNKLSQKEIISEVISSPKCFDFTIEELKADLTAKQMKAFNEKVNIIYKARYDSLFYDFRCYCVHEFRFPTPNAIDLNENSHTPQYYHLMNSGYILWIPPGVISLIFEQCYKNLKKDAKIDPYKIFGGIPICWIKCK